MSLPSDPRAEHAPLGGTEASRELTLPWGQGILKLLLVTGVDEIEDAVSNELKLQEGSMGCLGGKTLAPGPLTHLLLPILISPAPTHRPGLLHQSL